jgi:chaperonin GroES
MFRPLNDRVLVKPDDAEQVSPGGILIPAQAQEKAMVGTVIACGPGRWENGGFKEPQVKTGDKVIYGKYGGTEIQIDGVEHLVMSETDILGIKS